MTEFSGEDCKMKSGAIVACALALAKCATHADDIAAAYVSPSNIKATQRNVKRKGE